MSFLDQYKDPRWQKKRLEVLDLYEFRCGSCGCDSSQLHVHHPFYKKGKKVWEYESSELFSLCDSCHARAHSAKEIINQFFVSFGPDAETFVADLLSGISGGCRAGQPYAAWIGAGACYLANLSEETIYNLTKTNPDDLKAFVEGATKCS